MHALKIPELIGGDRRSASRCSTELPLHYRVLEKGRVIASGSGTTIDISRGGLCFEAETPLPCGAYVEVAVDWPFLLQNRVPLSLLLCGRVVRSHGLVIALETSRYEFETRGDRSFRTASAQRGCQTLFA